MKARETSANNLLISRVDTFSLTTYEIITFSLFIIKCVYRKK